MVHLLWAKKRKQNDVEKETYYHPLLFHMIDVASVVELLWKLVLERHLKEETSRKLGLEPVVTGKWLSFWAGLHDMGKATPVFQGMWSEARGWLHEANLSCPSPEITCPHGILTAKLLKEVFPQQLPGINLELARHLGVALGGHHGVFPRTGDLAGLTKALRGGKRWEDLQTALFQEFASLWEVSHLPPPAAPDPGHEFFLLLAGLVSVADWIGSNEEYFPFARAELDPQNYRGKALRQAHEALESLGWLGWQAATDFMDLTELFPVIKSHGPRPLQEATVKLGRHLDGPALVIIEAPMGEGKTEAAMYLADRWSVALGQKGCYFALPTMATSNQMFSRVKEFLRHRYPENLVNLQLLHGHASLTAEFQALRHRADRLFAPTDIRMEDEGTPRQIKGEVLAAEWFTHRKRGLLAPHGVGTVDQALLAVLNTKHYFVRLFGLAHKSVVVDEVHAYDAYMVKLLERLLEWLAALGCSVVLLSATLPGERRKALLKAYTRGLGGASEASFLPDTSYPRLTWSTCSGMGSQHFEASAQFSRTFSFKWVADSLATEGRPYFALGNLLQESLSGGGCAAVICNTIGRAQEVYAALQKFFPDQDAGDGRPELDLFHARYLFEEREEREQRALTRFGKPGGRVELGNGKVSEVRRPHRAVLVATQVIEQSLDLDFDLMVTEMAPVDLLLQRAGRLHRHVRHRPDNLNEPTFWILAPDLAGPVPAFGKGTEWVYDRHLLLRSWLVLKDRSTLAIPQDVEDLIESVYGEGPPPDDLEPQVLQAWQESYDELERRRDDEAYQAQNRYILPPRYVDDIMEDRNAELEEDDPAVHRSLQAATRLGDPTVALIFLYEVGGKVCLDSAGERPVSLEVKPDGATAMTLLRRSAAISRRGLTQWLLKQGEIPPGWLKHPLLCRHRLIRLDGEHKWRGGGCELLLDAELGVVITPIGKEVT